MDWRWIAGGVAVAGWLLLRGRSSSGSTKASGPYALIGDSLAVGLAGPLKQRLGGVTGWGVGGSIAALWTMQVEAVLVADPKPRTVIVSLGTNDSQSPDALSKFPARVKTIVDKVRAAGAVPVLLASPAKLSKVAETNAALSQTGALVLVPGALPLADGVHPTPAGYSQWASDIAGALA